ncbi:hypothetical protein ACT4US_08850, partial [Bacillus sp. HC-Mk]
VSLKVVALCPFQLLSFISKETYEQQVISNLGKFIGELGRVQEDIDQAIRRLEREIATCESSILSLSRSVSMVDANIQVEVQKAGK